MRSYRKRSYRRSGRSDGGMWLSFSDLMSSLLMIIILIMFYIMYQYFDMYEINMAEIARQQYDLDAANASLEEERGKLSEAEQQMLAQQIRINAAEAELEDAEAVLATQQEELAEAQSLLKEKEDEIAAQKESLDALSIQLGTQQTQLTQQQDQLAVQQGLLQQQQGQLAVQQSQLDEQQGQLSAQQDLLDAQQVQIEQLVGMKPRIISSLSDALNAANISATVDPASGAIALEADVLFSTGKYDLTDAGRARIDDFLPVYLDVLFSDEYLPYVAEIIIEGHTDSTGTYIKNLELSQQRAGAVATYVLSDSYRGISASQRKLLREMATANGRSFSDPVLDENGRENMDASRRVVFKFRLTDEQMIDQLKSILEKNDSEAGIEAVIEAAEPTAAPAAEPTATPALPPSSTIKTQFLE